MQIFTDFSNEKRAKIIVILCEVVYNKFISVMIGGNLMKKLFKVLAAGLMCLTVAACGTNKSGSDAAASDTLTVGAEELTGTFSPLYYTSAYDGYVVDLIYNKLLEYDVDNKIQPSLAESYTVSEDGTEIEFKLRKDVKFSNDSAMTAKDVEFSYKVVSDPSYTGRFGATTQFLEGHDAYASVDNATEPEFPGIEVLDDYTIKFNFTEARNDNLTTLMSISIISSEQFKDSYAYKNTKPIEEANGDPIGTGPYNLKAWEAGTGASFTRSTTSWQTEGYAIENIIIKPVKMETDYDELKNGSIDLLAGMIEPKKIGPASNNEDIEMNHYPRGGAGYITFNTAAGATSDKAVRQALAYAFNRKEFVDSYYDCSDCKNLDGVKIGYVPTTFNNPISKLGDAINGTEKVDGLDPYTFDVDKAAKILDDAGWKAGADGIREKDGEKLTIKILAIKDHDILNNLIPMWKKTWGETLGCDVQVATVDFNTVLSKIVKDASLSEWNMFFLATSYTSDSMSDIYTTFHSKYAREDNDNYSRLKDSELDTLLDSALKEMDPDAAYTAWLDVQKKINDDCAVVPVYGNTYFDMFNKKVKNMNTSALYTWPRGMKDATIE